MNIPILHEDDWLLIVDKPAGLLTIPSPRNESRTLLSILNDHVREKGGTYGLHPCHRLDRETSGVIIFAKGKAAQKKIMDLFHRQEVSKRYTAFVQGVPSPREGRIQYPIEGRPALTRYRTVEGRGNYSVVEVIPETGRTNQIRIHFKRIGHPLVGETKFAFRRDFALKARRVCLHACSVTFKHPATNQSIRVEAPPAADMAAFLAKYP